MASGSKRITQETFDEVVKENMEEFEMEPEEALQEAIQQFESQGVNLANIIKTLHVGEFCSVSLLQECHVFFHYLYVH